jgi:ferredoxin
LDKTQEEVNPTRMIVMNIQSMGLVYFSPTGTTKRITNEIAQAIHTKRVKVIDCTKPATRAGESLTFYDELVILGTPVHYGRVPSKVADYFTTFNAEKTPAVLVVTYGNRAFEDALIELHDVAINAGFSPIAAGAFIGEHAYSSKAVPIAHGRPDIQDMQKAREFGAKIQEKLAHAERLDEIETLRVPGDTAYRERGTPRTMSVVPTTKEKLCIQCGRCAEACPTGAIHRDGLTKTDKQKCLLCCACIKACPSGARAVRHPLFNVGVRILSQFWRRRREPEIYL